MLEWQKKIRFHYKMEKSASHFCRIYCIHRLWAHFVHTWIIQMKWNKKLSTASKKKTGQKARLSVYALMRNCYVSSRWSLIWKEISLSRPLEKLPSYSRAIPVIKRTHIFYSSLLSLFRKVFFLYYLPLISPMKKLYSPTLFQSVCHVCVSYP